MRRMRWAMWCLSTCPKSEGPSAAREVAGVVESVKAAADVFMPVAGEVTEVNEALRADPSLANCDPLGQAGSSRCKSTQPAEFDDLMDETAGYAGFFAEPKSPNGRQDGHPSLMSESAKPLAELRGHAMRVRRPPHRRRRGRCSR